MESSLVFQFHRYLTQGNSMMKNITWDDFQKVELRVGTIIEVNDFPEAKNSAFILKVDFGKNIGIRKSSAQITELYNAETLIGKQVMAVINFPPKQIGNMMSECLVTGFHREDGAVVLVAPDTEVPNGTKLA
jgi:tRNA-binding protein